jgi:hypothetical protein
MKKVFLSLIAMTLFTIALSAQGITTGTLMLGTSTSLSNPILSDIFTTPNNVGFAIVSSKFKSDNFDGDRDNSTIINIAPKVGTFMTEDLLVGAELIVAYLGTDSDDITALGAGPFVRYYFSPGNTIRPFGQLNAKATRVSVGDNDNEKANVLQFGLKAGAAFFIGEKVSIDATLGFDRARTTNLDAEDNARELQTAIGLGVGVSVFL